MAFPYLEDIVREITGIEIPLPIPTFGFFFALSMALAFWIFRVDITRKEKSNLIASTKSEQKLSELVPDFTVVTVIAGIIGARLFHVLEYPAEFVQDPIGMLFSRGGFTAIGGLLFGAVAGVLFVKRKGFPIWTSLDSGSLGMTLGYAVGRLGCQLAGDGDWGVVADLSLKPDWLPRWVWAQTYENNVIGQFIPQPGVYPTPVYESIACFIILGILWGLRKKSFVPGTLFFLYLIFSGIERFLVELIRVNSTYNLFGLHVTQAELLSVIMVVAGIVGITVRRKSLKA